MNAFHDLVLQGRLYMVRHFSTLSFAVTSATLHDRESRTYHYGFVPKSNHYAKGHG